MISAIHLSAQNYPSFGAEIKVFISGYASDAMEPFLSPDGNTLFFNSLNDGIQTRLHYATRVDDSTFTYMGEVAGANESNNPQLNAVASLDTTGNFVWVSARDYPNNFDNLHRADYVNDTCINVNRVHGNFYVYAAGWIVMDAMITYDGSELYYCNAFFDTCIIPCSAKLGIAARVNDSTFNTVSNSDSILQNVNDTNYAVYAPHLSADGLELYFTRYLVGGLNTEICVSVRNTTADVFSIPLVLITEFPNVPEATALNTGGNLLYYHKKINGTYAIHLRKKITTDVWETTGRKPILVFPNPASQELHIVHMIFQGDMITIFNAAGEIVAVQPAEMRIDVSCLPVGMYYMRYDSDGNISHSSFSILR
ncbi:MAG TPA: T9SS type A sorting domain-containing protein [Bacteroidia bacterium]|nr:T9SS type A sorting domain-containing protein [Bacteroidia bacterium]